MENLLKESSEFKLIFKNSLNLISGRYNSKIKGDGLEFSDLKIYQPGDDVRKIDWNITAKENKPYVREFLEEKDTSHYVLLDVSASMKNKFFCAKVLASSLILSSSKSRDNFTIAFFNSNEIKLFPLSKSKNKLMYYIYEISKITPNNKGDLQGVFLKFLNLISKKSIISIITDELEIGSKTKSLISAINFKHKLNYFQIFSSNEKNLEIGINSFEDVETGFNEIYDLNEEELIEYKNQFDTQLNIIKMDLINLGVRPFLIDSDLNLKNQIRKNLEVI